MALSKVSRRWLTSIPAAVRQALGIEEGDHLLWEIDEERRVAIVKVLKNPLRQLRGKYDDPRLTYENVEELADKIASGEADAGD